ncbi:hypothetical protein D9Q98_008167 [Chlorella vulgaris]|uniref:Uncharacterized protein n=1 Tax=Chlorella vulgaris TaxID=3077 RepID=A0A9D4YT55_CHLVU|nr:hypothetical protein D9Q98_008167 [Chlorella vulgaris]
MDDTGTRAAYVLDKLLDCGLGDGMTEEDIMGGVAREPLRSCCFKLAGQLWALCQHIGFADTYSLQVATTALRRSVNTEAEAAGGHLDASLASLARVLDPACAAGTRLEALELAVSALQAATLAAAALEQQQQGAAGGAEAADDGAGEEGAPMEEDAADPHAVHALSAALRSIAALLKLDAAATAPTAAALAAAVLAGVEQLLARLPPSFFEPVLPPGSLSETQLAILKDVDEVLRSEYSLRRRMLIERVKVTLQSFMWSPRLKEQGTTAAAQALVDAAVSQMRVKPQVAAADVFGATLPDLLAILERATSGDTGVRASVKSVRIGKVPDRGGRPEGRKRDADMPAWTGRKVTQGRGGRGRGGPGRGRGRNPSEKRPREAEGQQQQQQQDQQHQGKRQ